MWVASPSNKRCFWGKAKPPCLGSKLQSGQYFAGLNWDVTCKFWPILGALLLWYDLFMQAFKFISTLGCRCSACNWSSRRYNKEFIQGSLSPSIQDYTQLVCPRRGPQEPLQPLMFDQTLAPKYKSYFFLSFFTTFCKLVLDLVMVIREQIMIIRLFSMRLKYTSVGWILLELAA